MAWTLEYAESALRELRKLDRLVARRIVDFMDERIAATEDLRSTGQALSGPLGELWRYRVGDYRVVCDIVDKRLNVLVVKIGHRGDIYQ